MAIVVRLPSSFSAIAVGQATTVRPVPASVCTRIPNALLDSGRRKSRRHGGWDNFGLSGCSIPCSTGGRSSKLHLVPLCRPSGRFGPCVGAGRAYFSNTTCHQYKPSANLWYSISPGRRSHRNRKYNRRDFSWSTNRENGVTGPRRRGSEGLVHSQRRPGAASNSWTMVEK